MFIGVNEQHHIKQIGEITDVRLTVIELDRKSGDYPFEGWSDIRILNYSYEVQEGGGVAIYPATRLQDIEFLEQFEERKQKEASLVEQAGELEQEVAELWYEVLTGGV